jgi:hypothetical protein
MTAMASDDSVSSILADEDKNLPDARSNDDYPQLPSPSLINDGPELVRDVHC